MVVATVAQVIPQRSAQLTGKHVIHAIKRHISSLIVDHQDSEAKAKVENGGLTQTNKDNPAMTSMKLQQTTEIKMMIQTGSNMNRTLCKYCSVKVYVLTLNQTYSLMKLTGKVFSVCLLT